VSESNWTPRHDEAKDWAAKQRAMRRGIKRMSAVHGLPAHVLTVPRGHGYRKGSKLVKVVNVDSGAVVSNVEIEAGAILNIPGLVVWLLAQRDGIDQDAAKKIFDANEDAAKANRRYSPGRPKGSKNRINAESLARMEERKTKSKSPEYRKHVRKVELQLRPWMAKARDSAA
jgi:hypothetical protein